MPTVEATVVILVLVVPGAAYTWSFERHVGAFGIGAVDRTLRFVSASVLVHLLLGWAEFGIWQLAFSDVDSFGVAQFAAAWGVLVALTALPALTGWVVGVLWASRHQRHRYPGIRRVLRLRGPAGKRREDRLLRFTLGRAPAPRAWDHLFASTPTGLVRAQLKEGGSWIGGLFRSDSYAAGYPEEPQDLYLERAYAMADDGAFVRDNGDPVELGSGILVRWDEVRLLEFFHE